jgi:dihydrofolate reductase
MGATTYRLVSGFAAQMPDEPSMAEVTTMPKVVFSSTLEAPLWWANTELVDGDAVEAVRAMKLEASRPMSTIGSLTLGRSLLQAGLVDPLPGRRVPGHHRCHRRDRILDGYPDVALELVDHRTFDVRLQWLEYVPRVQVPRLAGQAPEEDPRTPSCAEGPSPVEGL